MADQLEIRDARTLNCPNLKSGCVGGADVAVEITKTSALQDDEQLEYHKDTDAVICDPNAVICDPDAVVCDPDDCSAPREVSLLLSEECRPSCDEVLEEDLCRICHCEACPEAPLICPCACSGSLKYVHAVCLQQWIKYQNIRQCELCNFTFNMRARVKPIWKWQRLHLSTTEFRHLICSVCFHLAAIGCVIWSLSVLIDRTADELRSGVLKWPFWTKLVVLGIGFTGAVVFMYIQCKLYCSYWRRWRSFNRIIVVTDARIIAHNTEKRQVKVIYGPRKITYKLT